MDEEGVTLIVPLDEYLRIDRLPFKITADLMLEVAFWGQNQRSYQEAENVISKVYGVTINDDTVRLVTNEVGLIVYENDCRMAEDVYARLNAGKLIFPSRKKDGILYIETDGSALNTRHRRDSDDSTWRENKLGMVFSTDNIRYWTDAHGDRQHSIDKREYVSYIGKASEFQKHLLSCALRNGYGEYKQTVLISDGATWIRNMKEELFPDAQQILDYYHLCENVNTYAKRLFGTEKAQYSPWSDKICAALKAGEYKDVLLELDKLRSDADTFDLYGYIDNNSNNIDYPTYSKKGYFVGSGSVESGNRIVLQQRLKQAGMRWNVSSAQPLLTLKAKCESNLWEKNVVEPFTKEHVGMLIS